MLPVLLTPRLRLTPHELTDAEAMNRWAGDYDLCHYSDDAPAGSESFAETRQYLERIIDQNDDSIRRWAVRRIDDGQLIGYCMAAFIDLHNRRCKIGLAIGEKAVWGQGYGREVLDALVRHCFEDLCMNRIGAEIYGFNERSIRLFEHAGFKREGIIRQNVMKNGHFEDEHIYGLLREEWHPSDNA